MSRKIYKNQFCPSQLTRGFEIRISQIKHVPVFLVDFHPPLVLPFVCVCVCVYVSLAKFWIWLKARGLVFFLIKDLSCEKIPIDFGANRYYSSMFLAQKGHTHKNDYKLDIHNFGIIL